MIYEFKLSHQDVFLQKTVLDFDVSMWEILAGLLYGATIVFLKNGQESNIGRILNLCINDKITICHFVPTFLDEFLSFAEIRDAVQSLNDLRYIISSGESLPYKTVERFDQLFSRTNTQLWNLYGTTEATIDVTFFNCTHYYNPQKIVPIGKPIWNTKIYILDENKQLCEQMQPGEIYIAGENVGKGYLTDKYFCGIYF